ncbi:hypothetical protein L9F63_001491 [Diploptera punctata]|uniref:Thioredoxin domain-containing protein n=1 Tax=Diploptera punctata TaxID=6984 RepID=A0AAD8A3S8_DIPPU|nr:hypothetical protein L9F63_001491 [Diploptera punctata]
MVALLNISLLLLLVVPHYKCFNEIEPDIQIERLDIEDIREDTDVESDSDLQTEQHNDLSGETGDLFTKELNKEFDETEEKNEVEGLPTAQGEEHKLTEGNVTVNATESSDDTTNATSNLVSCTTGKETPGQPVELVNSTRLINLLITEPNVTSRRSTADCVALLFYARYCPFSSMAAPHFNALARAFPDIKMAAVDAMKHHSFNTQYGIVGVPTVMLFHNGRPAAKFNDSEYTLEMFSRFITKYTGMEPQSKLFVTSADFGGPVPSVPVKETDYCLALSWIFILVCGVYFFSKSSWWRKIVETVQNTWREAEAQHEHVE